jgi:hypothetical protein
VYVRAAWRTRACAVCDRHGTPLRSTAAVGVRTSELQFTVVDGRVRVAGADETCTPPIGTDPAGLAAAGNPWQPEGLRRVLALQAALGRVLRGLDLPDGWPCAVSPAVLPAVCALIVEAMEAARPRSGEQPPHRHDSLLAACAAILETLSGRMAAGLSAVGWQPAPAWPSPLVTDLIELVQAIEPDAAERFATGAAAIGGSFASAVTQAVAWNRLDRLARQTRPGSWPAALLADPLIRQQLEGLAGHRQERGLDYLARKTLMDARWACVEAGATRARA